MSEQQKPADQAKVAEKPTQTLTAKSDPSDEFRARDKAEREKAERDKAQRERAARDREYNQELMRASEIKSPKAKAVDADELAGLKAFTLSLPSNRTEVVLARDKWEAEAIYKAFFGILSTDHRVDVAMPADDALGVLETAYPLVRDRPNSNGPIRRVPHETEYVTERLDVDKDGRLLLATQKLSAQGKS